jgi:multiple sugar transport system substrate-binding protein
MGREGEVVAELVPEFERTHPGIRVEVQQLPWSAAHEKLLTAFAGDSTPDLCQLGNTWIPEFAALTRSSRSTPTSPIVDDPARRLLSRHLGTNRVDGTLYGVPWYVDTSSCSIAATCSRRRATTRRRDRGPEWTTMPRGNQAAQRPRANTGLF